MSAMPRWIEPMRAVLTDERFSSPDWIYEPKLDGQRILTYRSGKSLELYTRNQLTANTQYPELVGSLRSQKPKSFLIDGEVVSLKPHSAVSSFSRLQERMHVDHPSVDLVKRIPVIYFVFDLLFIDGVDLRSKPLLERKSRLEERFQFGKHVRFLSHLKGNGEAYYRQACRLGWEGLIAKRADAPYRSARTRDWLKFKCVNAQELVIGGYSDPKGTRDQFGSLLLGYFDGPKLRFAGKVGTGFDQDLLQHLGAKLRSLNVDDSPFASVDISLRGLHWVKPELVAQIGFSEWTDDGKLRHPRFLGLRNDKAAKDVTRETTKPLPGDRSGTLTQTPANHRLATYP